MHGVHRRGSESELSERVEQLSETLLPRVMPYPTRERQALREAKQAIDDARLRLNEVARTVGSTAGYAERGRALPSELVEARSALDKAEKRAVELRDVFVKAKETRERKFLAAASEQLSAAGPMLVELIRLLNRGFDPLVQLAQYAASNNMPMPRALAMAAELQTALRRATMVVNALLPDRGEDEGG